MMKNPYFELHKEFRKAGAKVLMSSGQACVLFGIATFSKDGDWIVEESKESCELLLEVLSQKGALYRLGAPLDERWLSKGLTSHFEYFLENGYRMRVDICSRPPRVENLTLLWKNAGEKNGIDLVDLNSLIQLKQTRRIRDYNIIGTLAEVLGFNLKQPEIALQHSQDHDSLKKAVLKWSDHAKKCERPAVKMILEGKSRREIVSAIAIEQDEKIQADEERIKKIKDKSRQYQISFVKLNKSMGFKKQNLFEQHHELVNLAIHWELGK